MNDTFREEIVQKYSKDEIYQLIKNSHKYIGLKQVMRGISEGTIRCAILSTDCSEYIKATVNEAAKNHNITLFNVFTKKELGQICEIQVSAAVVGILK